MTVPDNPGSLRFEGPGRLMIWVESLQPPGLPPSRQMRQAIQLYQTDAAEGEELAVYWEEEIKHGNK